MKEKSKAAKDTNVEENAEEAEVSAEIEENNEEEVEEEEGSSSQKRNKNKHFVILCTADGRITFNGMPIMKWSSTVYLLMQVCLAKKNYNQV
jgi:hypothetical protein